MPRTTHRARLEALENTQHANRDDHPETNRLFRAILADLGVPVPDDADTGTLFQLIFGALAGFPSDPPDSPEPSDPE